MGTPSSENVVLGRGAVYFNRLDDSGALTGFRHLGNCDQFAIGVVPENLDMRDYTQQTSAPYKRVSINTELNLTVSGFEFDAFNLQLAFLGDAATFTQASSTVTAEELAGTAVTGLQGKYFRLAKRSPTGLAIVQGTATHTSGTDYSLVDSNLGLVKILEGGAVADGTALEASYTAGTVASLEQVIGGVKTGIEGQLLFVPNNTTGPDNECAIHRVSLTPNGEVGLISDEWGKWTLQGAIQSDAAGQYGGTVGDPFFRLTKRAA